MLFVSLGCWDHTPPKSGRAKGKTQARPANARPHGAYTEHCDQADYREQADKDTPMTTRDSLTASALALPRLAGGAPASEPPGQATVSEAAAEAFEGYPATAQAEARGS